MSWLERLVKRMFRRGKSSLPSRILRPYVPPQAETIQDALELADMRESVLDWRIREMERDKSLERRRYRT